MCVSVCVSECVRFCKTGLVCVCVSVCVRVCAVETQDKRLNEVGGDGRCVCVCGLVAVVRSEVLLL